MYAFCRQSPFDNEIVCVMNTKRNLETKIQRLQIQFTCKPLQVKNSRHLREKHYLRTFGTLVIEMNGALSLQ